MLHNLINLYDKCAGIDAASAHCDVPCKIYDPITAQIATLSTIRFMDLINELA
jgi:nickel superoxide dismutase